MERTENKIAQVFTEIIVPFMIPVILFALSFPSMFVKEVRVTNGSYITYESYYSSMIGQLQGSIAFLYVAYLIPVVTQIVLFITHKKKPALIYIESIYAVTLYFLALGAILLHLNGMVY